MRCKQGVYILLYRDSDLHKLLGATVPCIVYVDTCRRTCTYKNENMAIKENLQQVIEQYHIIIITLCISDCIAVMKTDFLQ